MTDRKKNGMCKTTNIYQKIINMKSYQTQEKGEKKNK